MATEAFSVKVGEPELVRPETPTPNEFMYVSNIDDQAGLRNHIPFAQFYRRTAGSPPRDDPVPLIHRALSRALVHYYPLAGRLRHAAKGKLVVECNGEGVVFREAAADVTIERLRKADGGLRPPFPRWGRFLADDVWGCSQITDSPLLRMQVTRLACGGIVLASIFNHCACDAFGALQFLSALADFSKDPSRPAPTVYPTWSRDLLKPRLPPRVSFPHPEYDPLPSSFPAGATSDDFRGLAHTSVFLSRADVSSLKRIAGGLHVAAFDAVAACLWRARARALRLSGDVRLLFPVDTRSRHHPQLPAGYYGTAVVFPCATALAAELRVRPLIFGVGRISAAKSAASESTEYRASVIDFLEVSGRPAFCGGEGVFVVSDQSRLRFADVDFGWGPAVYGGPGRAGTGAEPGMVAAVVWHRGEDGVEGVVVLVTLPHGTVEAFLREVRETVEEGAGWEEMVRFSPGKGRAAL